MQKQLSFVITATILLAVISSLYTVHIANAQNNMTSAGGAKNMTAGSNMTGAAGNATGGSPIHTAKPAGIEDMFKSQSHVPTEDLAISRQPNKVLPPTPPP